MKVLAGDMGGTKTLLLLAEVEGHTVHPLHQARYPSAEFDDLAPMLRHFLDECGDRAQGVEGACVGVAGPVEIEADGHQRARITALPWQLDSTDLARHSDLPRMRLINDFEAIGFGLDALGPDDLLELQAGQPKANAPRAVLGAGTGLGVGFLLHHGDGYRPITSEGGHSDFAAADAEQAALAAFMRRTFPEHLSWDRVLCGAGLIQIYHFLRGDQADGAEIAQAMAEGDPAAAISRFALEGRDPLAEKALQRFMTIYGQQAGNLALLVLARGGVYVAGGIATKILPAFQDGRFLEAFHQKGRMRELMGSFPVRVVRNAEVGLLGAALAATRA